MPGGGGAHSLALLPSINTYEGANVRAKDAAQAPVPGGFLCSEIAQMRTQEASAAWAPCTGDASSNTLRPRRLGSAHFPTSHQRGSSLCKTHRTFPVRGASQDRTHLTDTKGFTLVELIVVIVVLGILLA
ncbi:MAG: prepilin-type N-terminal cleavage/methylation domain-containing protein, partial [Coriobacteriales bacterium]|nr:prepilin-type N-terminal cleavage/methylation domain-containing protein [Coriobacteriales bacterium]